MCGGRPCTGVMPSVNINEETIYPNYAFYKIILNDVKNNKFYNYDDFRSIKLEVIANGKTFSMGHSDDKRFYLECRKIK